MFVAILFSILIGSMFPIVLKARLEFNLLSLLGKLQIRIFKFKVIQIRVKVKNGYIYLLTKKHTGKIKITKKNFSFAFIYEFIKLIFFRTNLQSLGISSEIGYINNAMFTGILTAGVDGIYKSFLSKIKNHKKSAHIFVESTPQYQQDVFKSIISTKLSLSIFDILYTLINTLLNLRGKIYEKDSTKGRSESSKVSGQQSAEN